MALPLPLARTLFRAASLVAPHAAGRAAFRLFCVTPPRRDPSAESRCVLEVARPFHVVSDGRGVHAWRWDASPDLTVRQAVQADLEAGRSPRRRPVVLLVHGWGGRASDWAAFVRPLVDAGFEVVALDAPGHGASQGRTVTLPVYARALLAVEAEVGPVAAVVGHSFGGLVGAYAAVGGPALPSRSSARRLVTIASPDRLADVVGPFSRAVGLSEEARRAMSARVHEVAGAPVATFSTAEFLRASPSPSLVVHDRADREVPFADGERAGRAATAFWATDGLGHRRVLRSDAVVERVVDFVRPLAEPSPAAPRAA